MAQGNRRRARAARSRTHRTSGNMRCASARSFGKPLWVEQLEDRRMLANFTVTNLLDLVQDGDDLVVASGSLRAAILAAAENEEGDTIFFSPNLEGTIFLRSAGDEHGPLTIADNLQIVGTGTRKIAIDGAPNRRVFEIPVDDAEDWSLDISGLTITGGTAPGGDDENAGRGGAIFNGESLTLREVVVSNSSAVYGGGIFNAGRLTVERSLILNNTAGGNGGGIHNGVPADDDTGGGTGGGTEDGPPPVTTIRNSTITGNSANGGSGSGYGGGLFNRDGNMNVEQCTIVGNSAYLGSGIGSWGNPLPEEPEEEGGDPGPTPDPVVFTTVSGSVLYFNRNADPEEIDIDVVGKGEPPEATEEDPDPEAPDLNPSINIKFVDGEIVVGGDVGGNNLIYGLGKQVEPSEGDLPEGTDPLFISDINGAGEVIPRLDDFGGSSDTFHPFYDETGELPNSPLIDHHQPRVSNQFDVRGRHFTRVYTFDPDAEDPLIDIGAVEVQHGSFVVDIIADASDNRQYSDAQNIESAGDFSIREALIFSSNNPLVDTISFGLSGQTDPTPSAALTLLLDNPEGALAVNHSVNIVGPSSFILEFDANDPSPVFGNGKRIFNITDNDAGNAVDVTLANLTLIRGDATGSGGAILNRENLTLRNMTLHNNRASLDGGAIHHDLGELTVISSTISGSNASDDGAIYIAQSSSTVTISNSTLSGNTAGDRGGAIFNRGTDTIIEFSTITNNNAGSTIASGVINFAGTLSVYSSIISANFINDFANQTFNAVTPTSTSLGYNLIGTANAAASSVFSPATNDIFSTNPGLAPLAFAGGLTRTHVLLETSPAINRGPETPTGEPTYDQRGNPFVRIFDGKEDGIDEVRMDIGAYELQGRVYRVDNAGDGSDGNYSTGNLTLREAIELSNVGPLFDVIEFDDMMLPPNPTISPSEALPITDQVLIRWQGSTPLNLGGSGTVFAVNDGDDEELIDVEITGGERGISEIMFQGRNIVSSENLKLAVIDILGNSTSAITHQLGALHIVNSIMTGNISSVSGGAINAQNASSVYIYDSSLTGNSTAFTGGHGGGIYLKNSPFEGNLVVLANNLTAAGASDGAGMYVEDSTVEFRQSVISGNTTTGANSDGAGIFARNSHVVLHDYTTMALNTTFGTSSRGGAIYLNGNGTLSISEDVTLTFNRTFGQYSHGGAIANVGGTVTIDGTDVSNNSTNGPDAHGGAIYVEEGSLTVVDSALFDNKTNGPRSDGGAIFSNTSLSGLKTEVLNSTVSGNSTNDRGGGIYNADGLTVIRHSTITNNSAPYYGFGAGVGSLGAMSTTRTEVGSSIISGNKVNVDVVGNTPSDVDRIGGSFQDTFVSLGYNLIGTGITTKFSSATNDLFGVLDPGLEDLADNGGSSRTHALKEDSQAINRGDPAAAVGVNGVPEFDQRGEARIKSGRIDIGAFESDFVGSLPGDHNGDGVVNGRDFLAWQRGQSPNNGSAGDLNDWQTNYGTSASAVAAVVTTEEVSESPHAALVVEEPATIVSAAVTEASATSPVVVGWFAMDARASAPETAAVEDDESSYDASYVAALADSFDDLTIAESTTDFGDIATTRSDDDSADDAAAEDAVFALLGAGLL